MSSSSRPRLPSTHPRHTTATRRSSSSSKTIALSFITYLAIAAVAHAAPIRPIAEAIQAVQAYQATAGRSVSATYAVPEQQPALFEEESIEPEPSTSMLDEVEEELRREMFADPEAGMPHADSLSSTDTKENEKASSGKPLSRSRRRRRAHP
ncbi:hypothetical protein FRB94_005338 [Tulasnella sp. JGI-2019a]|nr:hypothetical protein FRB93_002776 [Tulasnella sp. JGI-2019a]KAG9000592.1 hypothetical protein FRB94_005338 [Tulasnella sp. JGI-2019a]